MKFKITKLKQQVMPTYCHNTDSRDVVENNYKNIARSNEILGWEGVGNRQLLCFFKA
jgi:hypothetical protein